MTCGVLSYAPRNVGGMSCPACGVPVVRPGEAPSDAGDPGRRLDQLLRLTRDLLDVNVALLTEISGGREIIRRFDGDWPAGGVFQNASAALTETFCQRMLDGRIGNYIRDAQLDDQVSELAMVRELGIRAWIGVPIRLSDVELYMLCCLANEARPSIGEREVRLLAGLAESVRAQLVASSAEAG